MKKLIVSIITLIISLLIFFSGCLNLGGNDDEKNPQNAVIMTAREHNEDITIKTHTNNSYSKLYNTLNDGDLLIIKDIIDIISYDNKMDATLVLFEWREDGNSSFLEIIFDGDLTPICSLGDEVEISVTIKYVNFTYEELNYEMEIYNEQWVSEEFFKTDLEVGRDGFKPLPQNIIKKS
jgi:hypothetical protein